MKRKMIVQRPNKPLGGVELACMYALKSRGSLGGEPTIVRENCTKLCEHTRAPAPTSLLYHFCRELNLIQMYAWLHEAWLQWVCVRAVVHRLWSLTGQSLCQANRLTVYLSIAILWLFFPSKLDRSMKRNAELWLHDVGSSMHIQLCSIVQGRSLEAHQCIAVY